MFIIDGNFEKGILCNTVTRLELDSFAEILISKFLESADSNLMHG